MSLFNPGKKKLRTLGSAILASAMCLGALAGCGSQSAASDSKNIDTLKIAFVPSLESDTIITATAPLKGLLKKQLKKEGYNVKKVDITVGSSYDAVGESLSAGTVDVGFIPGGTYVLYDDDVDVLLTATRNGMNVDSSNPKDWNDAAPIHEVASKKTTSYRGLILAGPSEKGRELAKKVNSGKKLTWNDLNSANWSVMSASSSAGYIYPSLWLNDHYGKTIGDLAHTAQSDSYGSAFARLAQGQFDVLVDYADARLDFESQWTKEFGRKNSIWQDTAVIGVTKPIYNDTISVSKRSSIMSDSFKKALSTAFIDIAKTPAGKKVIAVYTHKGYKVAKSSDYDNEREAQ